MKIAITGHTSGIGKGLYDHFIQGGHDVVGLSRTTGYDLSVNLWDFVRVAVEQDVFINNAHDEFAQSQLLAMIGLEMAGKKASIINIGSISADLCQPFHPEYTVQKSALDRMAGLLANSAPWPKIMMVRPGLVDTPRVTDMPEPKLAVRAIVDVVDWLVNLPEHVYVPEITVRHVEQAVLVKR